MHTCTCIPSSHGSAPHPMPLRAARRIRDSSFSDSSPHNSQSCAQVRTDVTRLYVQRVEPCADSRHEGRGRDPEWACWEAHPSWPRQPISIQYSVMQYDAEVVSSGCVSTRGRTSAIPQRRAGAHVDWLAVVPPAPPASHSEYVLRGRAP